MLATLKQECTAEFKEPAVKRVQPEATLGAVARDLGLVEQTPSNGAKAAKAGKRHAPAAKAVTPEQVELSHVRAENARLQMENEVLKSHLHGLPRHIGLARIVGSSLRHDVVASSL